MITNLKFDVLLDFVRFKKNLTSKSDAVTVQSKLHPFVSIFFLTSSSKAKNFQLQFPHPEIACRTNERTNKRRAKMSKNFFGKIS